MKLKLSLSHETTLSVGVDGWVGEWVAEENRNKTISSSKLRLKLKMSLAITICNIGAHGSSSDFLAEKNPDSKQAEQKHKCNNPFYFINQFY